MKRSSTFLSLASLFLVAISFIACNDHREFAGNAKIQLVATLSGSAEKPTSVSSTGSGSFTGVLDRATRVLSYTVTYAGITPVAVAQRNLLSSSQLSIFSYGRQTATLSSIRYAFPAW